MGGRLEGGAHAGDRSGASSDATREAGDEVRAGDASSRDRPDITRAAGDGSEGTDSRRHDRLQAGSVGRERADVSTGGEHGGHRDQRESEKGVPRWVEETRQLLEAGPPTPGEEPVSFEQRVAAMDARKAAGDGMTNRDLDRMLADEDWPSEEYRRGFADAFPDRDIHVSIQRELAASDARLAARGGMTPDDLDRMQEGSHWPSEEYRRAFADAFAEEYKATVLEREAQRHRRYAEEALEAQKVARSQEALEAGTGSHTYPGVDVDHVKLGREVGTGTYGVEHFHRFVHEGREIDPGELTSFSDIKHKEPLPFYFDADGQFVVTPTRVTLTDGERDVEFVQEHWWIMPEGRRAEAVLAYFRGAEVAEPADALPGTSLPIKGLARAARRRPEGSPRSVEAEAADHGARASSKAGAGRPGKVERQGAMTAAERKALRAEHPALPGYLEQRPKIARDPESIAELRGLFRSTSRSRGTYTDHRSASGELTVIERIHRRPDTARIELRRPSRDRGARTPDLRVTQRDGETYLVEITTPTLSRRGQRSAARTAEQAAEGRRTHPVTARELPPPDKTRSASSTEITARFREKINRGQISEDNPGVIVVNVQRRPQAPDGNPRQAVLTPGQVADLERRIADKGYIRELIVSVPGPGGRRLLRVGSRDSRLGLADDTL